MWGKSKTSAVGKLLSEKLRVNLTEVLRVEGSVWYLTLPLQWR